MINQKSKPRQKLENSLHICEMGEWGMRVSKYGSVKNLIPDFSKGDGGKTCLGQISKAFLTFLHFYFKNYLLII